MALSYNLLVTGDCSNSGQGAFYLEPQGGNPPYNINWVTPNLGSDLLSYQSIRTNLSAGPYLVEIYDSTTPSAESLTRIFTIGTTLCVTVDCIETTCGQNNGIIFVTASTTTNSVDFYLYNSSSLIETVTTNGTHTFTSLSPGLYYIEAFDLGGCSGRSATCVVLDSSDLEYDLVGVDNSVCSGPNGRAYVTNQNGQAPYTYLWNTGSVNSYITGLTAGNYSVTVTDSLGCSKQKSVTIQDVQPPGFISTIITNPNCFQNDGSFTATITGGTPAFYYYLSNGDYQISYSRTITFSGLTQGNYNLTVTDGGLCTATTNVLLVSPNYFVINSVIASGSTCNLNSGSISAIVSGGLSNYTFELYSYTSDSTTTTVNSTGVVFFYNLSSGFYKLTISNGSNCEYEQIIEIINIEKYSIDVTTVNPTCEKNNGSITVTISTPNVLPCIVSVTGQPDRTINSLTTTFNDLTSGIYTILVRDSLGCDQTETVALITQESIQFTLLTRGCGTGNEGSIVAVITQGEAPFELDWSSNVGSQEGIYVTGLTEGDYSVTITDNNGCFQTKSTKILCGSYTGDYKTDIVCENTFTITPNTELGISEMFYQGYIDLTSGETNCLLNSADFTIFVNVDGNLYTDVIYTSYSLQDYPTDEYYTEQLENLLNFIPGLGSVIIDLQNNLITLATDCERTLSGENITIGVSIEYNICCVTTTTTTCKFDDCFEFNLQGKVEGEYVYYDCNGSRFTGKTSDYTFCANQFYGAIVYDSNLTLIENGCCADSGATTTTTTTATTTTTTSATTTTTTVDTSCKCYWLTNSPILEGYFNGRTFIVTATTFTPVVYRYVDCTVDPQVNVGPLTLVSGSTGFCSTISGFEIIGGSPSVSISNCTSPCTGTTSPPNGNCIQNSDILISNQGNSGQISGVTPSFYNISTQGFPVDIGQTIYGTHGSYTGPIGVRLAGVPGVNVGCLYLYVNGILRDTTPVLGNGNYVLGNSLTQINDTDCVEIIFTNDNC